MVQGQVQLRLKTGVSRSLGEFRLNSEAGPSKLDFAVVGLALFLLAFGFPNDWFRVITTEDSVNLGGGLLVQAVYLPLFCYLFLRLSTNTRIVVDAFRREPLIVLFMAMVVISALWSPETSATFRRAIAVSLTGAFAICICVRFSLKQFLGLLAVVLIPGTLLSLLFVVALPQYGVGRLGWSGIFINKNVLGRHEVMAFMIYAIASGVFPRYRLRLLTVAAVSAFLVVNTTSATSLVALSLLAANLILFRVFRARGTLYGAVIGSFFLTGIVSVGVVFANLGALTALLGKDVTFTGRTTLWLDLVGPILERPLLGVGWDAYWRGWFSPSHEVWIDNPWLPIHAHNAFIDYLLTVGLVGCSLVVLTYARAIARAARFIQAGGDTLSLFPVIAVLYSFVYSLTEAGVIGRHIRWVLFVVAVQTVAQWRHAQASARADTSSNPSVETRTLEAHPSPVNLVRE